MIHELELLFDELVVCPLCHTEPCQCDDDDTGECGGCGLPEPECECEEREEPENG